MGMMMVVSFVIAVIVGILLALHFKVFVLVPATLLAVAVIVASNYQPKPAIALTVIGSAVLLQIGYVVGVVVRALLQRRSKAGSSDFSKSRERFSSWRWDRGPKMAANVSGKQVANFEMASQALNAGVTEYLSAVLDRGGSAAFDMVGTNLVTDVCVVMVQQLGPERLLEVFDNIEMAVNPSELPNLIGPSRREA